MFFVFSLLSFVTRFNSTEYNDINLYQLVGLSKTAKERDVLKAYRNFVQTKARQPNPSARTLKLWEQTDVAFDVLGNPDSRALYDAYGNDFLNVTGFQISGYQSDATLEALQTMLNNVPEELLNYGGMVFYPIQFDILEFMNGAEKSVKVVRTGKCKCPGNRKKCAACRKSPFQEEIVQHKISLPPGAPEYHRILVKGLGDTTKGRGASDIIFIAYCTPDFQYYRKGADIHTDVKISLAEAIRGGDKEIENIDGEKLFISMKGGVQHGEQKRITGKGLPVFLDPTEHGDLVVTFWIDFPESLTEEQRKVIGKELPEDESFYE